MPHNSVTIVGNLTNDPEMRFTPAGQAVAKFTVAYSERYRNASTGNWEDGDTSYFNVYAWADLGEHVAETFVRGNRVIVTGTMRQRVWETKEGEKRYTVEIRADDVGASVRFATAAIRKAVRTRPDGPADSGDPWDSASPQRPATEPAPAASPEPAPDGSQSPAEPAAGAASASRPRKRRAARTAPATA